MTGLSIIDGTPSSISKYLREKEVEASQDWQFWKKVSNERLRLICNLQEQNERLEDKIEKLKSKLKGEGE